MNFRYAIITAAASAALFLGVAAAQHDEHHPEATAPGGKAGTSGMMAQMPHMMMGQNDIAQLAEKLQKSFAAIEAEKDPAALKTKLAEHGALLKELQTKAQAQSHMMTHMNEMMTGHMMGEGMHGSAPGNEQKK